MPDYKIDEEIHCDLDDMLQKFCESKDGTMLILGQPGMGKSSITAYLANKYKNDDKLIILKFRDWEDEDIIQAQGLKRAIFNKLNCRIEELEDKILILDGFDEIKYSGYREKLLNTFLLDVREIDSFRLIITSRENYIGLKNIKFEITIVLQPFDKDKINEFSKKIFGDSTKQKEDESNIEVLGIPVILYMALVVGIDITTDSSKSELYEKIFALEGGIFDRFSSYESGAHPIEYNKEEFHNILQLLAFEMFDKNQDIIKESEYLIIAKNSIKDIKKMKGIKKSNDELKDIIFDFPIKNLYEKGNGIEFVHKSIYEYFVAEYFCQQMKQAFSKETKEGIACKFGMLFKGDVLNNEMFKYEILIFVNLLEVIHLWVPENKGLIIFNQKTFLHLVYYIKYSTLNIKELNLSKIKFVYAVLLNDLEINQTYINEVSFRVRANEKNVDIAADFSRLYLSIANLSEADLSGANLSNTDLSGAKLIKTKLSGAILNGADLSGADLSGAELSGTIFDEINIQYIEDYYPEEVEKTRVWLESDDIVNYAEYERLQ